MQIPPISPPACSFAPDFPCVRSRQRPRLRPGLHPRLHPPLYRRRDGSDGFSLVEVLVATGLLITSVMSLAQLFVLATRANAAAGEMTEATLLAAQKIEELRAAPFPSVLGSQSVDYLDSRGERLGSADSDGRRAYMRRWWIESLRASAAGSTTASTVAVTVVVSRYRLGDRDTPGSGDPPGERALPQEIARVVTLRTQRAE